VEILIPLISFCVCAHERAGEESKRESGRGDTCGEGGMDEGGWESSLRGESERVGKQLSSCISHTPFLAVCMMIVSRMYYYAIKSLLIIFQVNHAKYVRRCPGPGPSERACTGVALQCLHSLSSIPANLLDPYHRHQLVIFLSCTSTLTSTFHIRQLTITIA
jgi:hypothetical protein